jgi:sulfide:quinone oxidoreductase
MAKAPISRNRAGLETAYLPVVSGQVGGTDATAFGALLNRLPKRVLAYSRTGTRSATLWSLSEAAHGRPMPDILGAAKGDVFVGQRMAAQGVLKNIRIGFYPNAPTLFGVKEYVPALMQYVEKYGIALNFQHTLSRIDGPAHKAWFTKVGSEGNKSEIETDFDMIHVVPPQTSPDFLRVSPLADAAGWLDVHQATLRHKTVAGVYGLGDACNAPNAKTAAAARKQAPIVAHNLLKDMGVLKANDAIYDGYGSCPLTVERGRIVLAEFGYGGKLLRSFPKWFIDGQKPSKLAWLLKGRMLPFVYWKAMLKGREWLATPELAG